MAGVAMSVSWLLAALAGLLFVLGAASILALVKGCRELRRALQSTSDDFGPVLLKSPLVPAVSMIYAPPTAGPHEQALLRRLLDLHFGNHEVVLVLDGHSRQEMAVWTEEFRLVAHERTECALLPAAKVHGFYVSRDPIRLLVVDKEKGGESDAIDAGVNAASFPVVGMVEPSAEFLPILLLRLIRPLLEDPEGVFAVCAMAPPPPAPGLAGHIAAIETARLWLGRCAAFAAWDKLMPVPGSAILVRRDAVIRAGGCGRGAADLFARIYAGTRDKSGPWRVAFVAGGVSWPRAAKTWADLAERTRRDQCQLASLFRRHGWSAGRELRGLFALRVLRPLLETAALVLAAAALALGWIPWRLAVIVLLSSAGIGMVVSMTAVVLRELADPATPQPTGTATLFLAAISENFGYRQLRNLWLLGSCRPPPQNKTAGQR